MKKISVALAGPWWTLLSYLAPERCAEGARVRAPVGGGGRVGLVVDSGEEPDYDGDLKEIIEIIDDEPILPGFMIPLIRWFGDTYLCGAGTAVKTLLPARFLKGDKLGLNVVPRKPASGKNIREDLFIYEPVDSLRWRRYAELASDGLPTLICFPIYDAAAAFVESFSESAFLYPRSGAAAEWRAWGSLLSQEGPRLVVGGQTAASAPLPGIARIIVEDESNNAWRTVRPPVFNVRSLLSKRARIEGASLVLGGRMPSSRVYSALERSQNVERGSLGEARPRNFLFVDLKMAYSPSVKGVQDSLAVSEPLVRETEAAIARGSWAVWILDRKGYAGEILCEECGVSLCCSRCGGALRWEASANRLACVSCGALEPVPESCPRCFGKLLMARRPGLEALVPLARSAINGPAPVLPLESDERAFGAAMKSPSGLMLGTRSALSLCDRVTVGMVGWIDADGEARSQDFDARARAFGLIWESRWRGLSPGERVVLLQTRRPGRDWQRGFEFDRPDSPGWGVFWRGELKERREFSMPPFASLVRIDAHEKDAREMTARFDDASFEYWMPDSPVSNETGKLTIWLRTNNMAALRNALRPFFTIKRAQKGRPSIIIRHE